MTHPMIKRQLNRLRSWLIVRLAGRMVVILNAHIDTPFVLDSVYGGTYDAMIRNTRVGVGKDTYPVADGYEFKAKYP